MTKDEIKKREKKPDWLIDIQNRSWEPEILISGITLTFLFLLSNHIYNFYGMLIQEFNVRYIIGKNLYVVSMIILTGLKVGLIFHLILRGIWTGFVGLSYVFPDGINKENIPKEKRNIEFYKPEKFVIKFEKLCSLLFSFIFSSIIFVGSFCVGMIPFALLYIVGLDILTIKVLILYVFIPIYMLIGIIWIFLSTKKKSSKLIEKSENGILNNILTTYFTNMGKKKTLIIFISYFIFISMLSYSDIIKFDFQNKESTEISYLSGIVQLNQEHYHKTRDNKVRISRATLDKFRVADNNIQLFISFYKEDLFTLRNLIEDPASLKELDVAIDSANIEMKSLYSIYIDETPIPDVKWYGIDKIYPDQKGIIINIPTKGINPGYHELKIDKIYWINKKKKIKQIKNWDIIPFELQTNLIEKN